MLVDFPSIGRVTVDPAQYIGGLIIGLDADDHAGCGVFSGRHFATEFDEEKLLPIFSSKEFDYEYYRIDCPPTVNPHQSMRWYYVAIGWNRGVYISHPYSYEITLEESRDNGGDSLWTASIHGPDASFNLILPDYKPGALL